VKTKTRTLLLTIIASLIISGTSFAANFSPYYLVDGTSGTLSELKTKLTNTLKSNSFKILGEYNPSGNSELYVVAFTRDDLTNLSLKFENRGALGSVMKAALRQTAKGVELSFINPEYMFNAYFMNKIENQKSELIKISDEIKSALKSMGTGLSNFGGEVSEKDLQGYQYMWGMPEFTDPVELEEFSSFEEGVKVIRANLDAKKGNTIKVYEQYIPGSKIIVFGVGIPNTKVGEGHFLPIIGDKHIAAMPYEIILQGNTATILHGRFRFALYWPELTMGTFTKIMSTPGDVENVLEELTEK